jgi:oligoendopeptidase F
LPRCSANDQETEVKKTQPQVQPSRLPSWNLTDLYAGPDDPALLRDVQDALEGARGFETRYRGRVAGGWLSAAELAEAVAALEGLSERIRKVLSYASLLFAADTGDPRRGALYQSTREQATALREHLAFFELEWSALSESKAQAYLASHELATYRHYLEVERRLAPHRLSEPEELILEVKANTGVHAFERLFDEVISCTEFMVTTGRRRETLNEQEVLARLHATDRAVRKAAARGLPRA